MMHYGLMIQRFHIARRCFAMACALVHRIVSHIGTVRDHGSAARGCVMGGMPGGEGGHGVGRGTPGMLIGFEPAEFGNRRNTHTGDDHG
jgi:hypothetical protein